MALLEGMCIVRRKASPAKAICAISVLCVMCVGRVCNLSGAQVRLSDSKVLMCGKLNGTNTLFRMTSSQRLHGPGGEKSLKRAARELKVRAL